MAFFQRRKEVYKNLSPPRSEDGSFPRFGVLNENDPSAVPHRESLPAGKVRTLTERFESILPSSSEVTPKPPPDSLKRIGSDFPKFSANVKPDLQFHPLADASSEPCVEKATPSCGDITNIRSETGKENNSEDSEAAFWNDQAQQHQEQSAIPSNIQPSPATGVETPGLNELRMLKETEQASRALDSLVQQAAAVTLSEVEGKRRVSTDRLSEPLTIAAGQKTKELESRKRNGNNFPSIAKDISVDALQADLDLKRSDSIAESLLQDEAEDEDVPFAGDGVTPEPITDVIARLREAPPEDLPKLLKKEWKRTRLVEANREFRTQVNAEINLSNHSSGTVRRVEFSEKPQIYYIESTCSRTKRRKRKQCSKPEDLLFPGDCRTSPEILADYFADFGHEVAPHPVKDVLSFLNCMKPSTRNVTLSIPKRSQDDMDASLEQTTIELVASSAEDDVEDWPATGGFSDILSVGSGSQCTQESASTRQTTFSDELLTPVNETSSETDTAFSMPPLTPAEILSSFNPPKESATTCNSPTDVACQFQMDVPNKLASDSFQLPSSFCVDDDDPPLTMLPEDEDEEATVQTGQRNHLYLLEESINPSSPSLQAGEGSF